MPDFLAKLGPERAVRLVGHRKSHRIQRPPHYRSAMTTIATVPARICATFPNNAVRFSGSRSGLPGTATTLPGPGLGDEESHSFARSGPNLLRQRLEALDTLVVEWASLHEGELLDNWHRLHNDELPRPIVPLA